LRSHLEAGVFLEGVGLLSCFVELKKGSEIKNYFLPLFFNNVEWSLNPPPKADRLFIKGEYKN